MPTLRFAVAADLHLCDTSLEIPGPAYQSSLLEGPKLIAESRQIFEAASAEIASAHPDFLLVCGDLTRDGELASHRLAAAMLSRLRQQGIGVYVVPGNHDVANPHAARSVGDRLERVDTVTAEEFSSLYAECGYRDAIRRDPGSLSYVAEPAPRLWLLALDACRYRENGESPVTAGRLSPATIAWVREVLSDARAEQAFVLVVLHHAITEHFRGEKTWLGEYVVDDYDAVAELLARGGVRVAFTGHGHAQDITLRTFSGPGSGSPIYDVETGSTVSWPSPWRMVQLRPDGIMRVQSHFVAGIAGGPQDFPGYAKRRLRAMLEGAAASILRRMLVSDATAKSLGVQIASAGLAFYRGDEPSPWKPFDLAGADPLGALAAMAMTSTLRDFQIDLLPADNDADLPLAGVAGF